MARLIDADALVATIKDKIAVDKEIYPNFSRFSRVGMRIVIGIIKNQDTVDPVKHGRWVFVNDMVSYIKCSECGDDICWVNTKRPKYCPSCGARMDGSAND